MNWTVSPTEALTLVGSKASWLPLPTVTVKVSAETVETKAARATEAREKCILNVF